MITRRVLLGASAGLLTTPMVARAQAEPYVLGTLFSMSGPNAEYGRIWSLIGVGKAKNSPIYPWRPKRLAGTGSA